MGSTYIGGLGSDYQPGEKAQAAIRAVAFAASKKTHYVGGYCPEDASDVARSIASENNRVIIGNSLGAHIALSAAQQAERAPETLILVNPALGLGDWKTRLRYAMAGSFAPALTAWKYPDVEQTPLTAPVNTRIVIVSCRNDELIPPTVARYVAKQLNAAFVEINGTHTDIDTKDLFNIITGVLFND